MQYQDDRVTPESIRQGREDARLRSPGIGTSAAYSFGETLTEFPRFAFDVGKKAFGMGIPGFEQVANVLPNLRMNLAKGAADLSFSEMFDAFPQAGREITSALHTVPARNPLDDTFEIFNKAMDTPYEGWGQKTIDFFASIAGYANPLTDIGLVKPAAALAESSISALGRALPQAAKDFARTPIKNFGGKLSPTTYGEVGDNLAKAMAIGTSVTAPGAMLDNYDKKTDSFNITGAVEQSLANGFLSIALDGLVIAAGLKFGNHKRISGKEYENPMPGDTHRMPEFEEALNNNEITPDDHKWISSFISGDKSIDELKTDAMNQLSKEGFNINHADNTVRFNLIKESHYNDFQSAMMDQISSGANGQYSTSFSDYIAGTGIDFFKSENAQFSDTLNGYVSFMEKRLAKEPDNLKSIKKARKSTVLEHIKEDHELSQKNILKYLKIVGYDVKNLPHAIPENLRLRARQEKQRLDLKRKLSDLEKLSTKKYSFQIDTPEYEEKLDKILNNLNELSANKQKYLTPNQELKKLEEHFLGEKGLPKNYQISHDYHRLIDLSHVSPKAEALLHHVKLKNEYGTQNAYKDFLKYMNTILESNVSKYADPDKVVDYFKSRHEKSGNYPEDKGKIQTGKQETTDVKEKNNSKGYEKSSIENSEEILKANQVDIDRANDPELTSLYKKAVDRLNQFKENNETLSKVVSCDSRSK